MFEANITTVLLQLTGTASCYFDDHKMRLFPVSSVLFGTVMVVGPPL